MTGFPPPNGPARAEAANWLARVRAEDCSEDDRRLFQHWLASDPDRARAFEAVSAMWESAGALPREICDKEVPRDLRGKGTRRIANTRREVLAGLSAAIVVGGTFSFWRSAQASVYQTEVGEQKHVVLADSSRVFLDTDTRIKVLFDDKLRLVDLERGRANFNAAPDAKRPFWVNAARRRVLAGNGILDVRREGDTVSVVVIRGTAAVAPVGKEKSEILKVGERLVVGQVATPTLDRPNLARLLAWQTGRAMFDNEKLSNAIDEMNRYSTMKLAFNNRLVGEMRISGVYGVGDNVSFANSVSQLLPVKIVQTADKVEFVPDPARLNRG